jgi:hypothetical protein
MGDCYFSPKHISMPIAAIFKVKDERLIRYTGKNGRKIKLICLREL